MYSCIDNKTLNETDLANFRFLFLFKKLLFSITYIDL